MKPAITIKGRFEDCSWTNHPFAHVTIEPRKNRLTAFPANDRKVVAVAWPSDFLLLLPQFLELHSKLTLLNFVIGENLNKVGHLSE